MTDSIGYSGESLDDRLADLTAGWHVVGNTDESYVEVCIGILQCGEQRPFVEAVCLAHHPFHSIAIHCMVHAFLRNGN